jgi:hypothetical protein
MGTLIQFRKLEKKVKCVDNKKMCPSDWEEPYNPTHKELRLTLDTLDECYNDTLRQIATAGVQSEFTLRERLHSLENMRSMLWNYYRAN